MYDLIIVGGGPAGLTLARLLGDRFRILILEKRDLLHPFVEGMPTKCCGGLLAPDAQKALAEDGLSLPGEVLESPQLFAVHAVELGTNCDKYYQRFYLNIDREAFDRYLAKLLPKSVELRVGVQVFDCDPVAKKVSFRINGRDYVEEAHAIVAADGANSLIRRKLQLDVACRDRYIAIQEWYPTTRRMDFFSALFDVENSDFYGWMIPKREGVLLGIALTPGALAAQKFVRFRQKVEAFQGFSFGQAFRREGAFIIRPRRRGSCLGEKQGIYFIGEAGGWISPSSAEGFSYAFESAGALAEHLLMYGFGGTKKFSPDSLRLNIAWKNLKAPVMYRPFLRKIAMHSNLSAIKVPNNTGNG